MAKQSQRIREWLIYQLMTPVRWGFEVWMKRKKLVVIYCVMGNGIGDALAISTILKYLHERDGVRGIVLSMHPDLFLHNPMVAKNLAYKSMASLQRSLLKSFFRGMRGNSCICFGGEVWTLGTSPFSREHLDDRRKQGWVWLQHLMPDHVMDVDTKRHKPAVYFSQDELTAFEQKFAAIPKPFAVLKATVGGGRPQGSYLKNWDTDQMAAVIRQMNEISWVQIGEISEPAIPGALNFLGKTSLRESMYLVSQANVMLGVEGFLTHVAAAFDVPAVIPMTGAYDPMAFVYPSTHPVLANPMPDCSPCWKTACPLVHMLCRSNIRVEAVVSELQNVLHK